MRFAYFISSLALVATAVPAVAQAGESQQVAAVAEVLGRYRAAIERLDASGTQALFSDDSEVFENGGVEGTYANYLAHHLGPELGHFRSFRFGEHRLSVRFEGPVALASESYTYRIERAQGDPIERRGVTTSVLRRTAGGWRIVSMHGSSRAPRPAAPAQPQRN